MKTIANNLVYVFVLFFVLGALISSVSYVATGQPNPFASTAAEACCGGPDGPDGPDGRDGDGPNGAQCTLTIVESEIDLGESTTLTYSVTPTNFAITGFINPGNPTTFTTSGPTGSFSVSPTEDTTYIGEFTVGSGEGGIDVTCSVSIVVNPPVVDEPPTCELLPTGQQTITDGDTIDFSWVTTNADAANFSDGTVLSSDLINNNFPVTPSVGNTTYTLTASKAGFPDAVCITSAQVTAVGVTTPDITIVKDDNDNRDDTQTVDSTIGIATFSIVVTNTGTEDLVNVVVSDPLEPSCNKTIGNLAIGASDTYTCNSTNVQSSFTNVASVTGDSAVDGDPVSANDPTNVVVLVVENQPPVCDLNPKGLQTLTEGGTIDFNWTTVNAETVTFTKDDGALALISSDANNPSFIETPGLGDTTYTLTASKAGFPDAVCITSAQVTAVGVTTPAITIVKDDNDNRDDTQTVDQNGTATFSIVVTNTGTEDLVNVVVSDPLEPSCNKTIGNLAIGASDTYTCNSTNVQSSFTNVASVTGDSAVDGDPVDSSDTTDVVVSSFSCAADVTYTANPTSLPVGGGNVTLNWATQNVTSLTINNTGFTSLTGTDEIASVAATTNLDMNVTFSDGSTEVCPMPITVDTGGSSFSCASNVTFTSNRVDVGEGNLYTLSWNVTDADTVSINEGLGVVSATDSRELRAPNGDTTINYVLTAVKGNDTITCPLDIRVDDGGGGGGGSSSPRCDFDASDLNVAPGEEVTLSWDNSRVRDLTLFEGDEDDGEKLFETDDNDLVEEGEFKVRPTVDTTYTLLVERGSRDRKCTVDIRVTSGVVLSAERTQGQVAGISLTSVPYTGFEAGPFLTAVFYTLLAIWALFVAYLLVIKEDRVLGMSMAGAYPKRKYSTTDPSTDGLEKAEETSEAAAYVASMTAQADPIATAAPIAPQNEVPANLPVAPVAESPVAAVEAEVADVIEVADDMKVLEDRAHASKVLLSSDAMRHFLTVCPQELSRLVFLDQVIAEAKITFPTEDGWVVLNQERMHELCEKRMMASKVDTTVMVAEDKKINATATEVPTGAGSLAEAIVVGNVPAAYQLLGNRPMIALADAAADLDSLYRVRKGEVASISQLLDNQSAHLTIDQIETAITALTSAIDGTYTDEAAAVKMAIMKAVKATS